MSYDQHPWESEDEEIRKAFNWMEIKYVLTRIHKQQLAEKDAKIEQLKELIAELRDELKLREIQAKEKALITKLCDLLARSDSGCIQEVVEFIQRAREATK